MRTSEQIDQIGTALAKAQAKMTHAAFDAVNPAFKSKYATLASIVDAIRPALSANGICYVQSIANGEDGIYAVTRLIHASGQWLELFGPIVPVDKRNAHGSGSATTYAKRFGLAAAVGIAADADDDGNAAADSAPTHPEYERYLSAIDDADAAALNDIATELARSTLPAPLKSKLRAAFSARKHTLAQVAA